MPDGYGRTAANKRRVPPRTPSPAWPNFCRMYVYTGGAFTPDQWFGGVRKGHTFVTAGPMLDFTMSGHLPGDEFTATKGENLKIHARAMIGSLAVRLDPLEIVANGDVIRTGDPGGASASLDFELPADRSMWIAARVTGAHSTPVYVTVDGKRHWKSGAVPALLEKRLTILKDIDKLIDEDGTSINPGREIECENAESFRRGTAELRNMVREAREVYLQLHREYEAVGNDAVCRELCSRFFKALLPCVRVQRTF